MTHYRKRYVTTRFWNTRKNPDFFPELHDEAFASDYVKARKDFGICFSGGGTRSASATIGQLRGLKKAGLLDKVGYISAVSGGSWGSAAFIFLPEKFDEDVFLGPYISPEELSVAMLGDKTTGSMTHVISKTVIGDDFIKAALSLSGDESFARAVGKLFLEPFDLYSLDHSIAFDERTIEATLAANNKLIDSNYYLEPTDFITARKNRPFYILNATLLRKDNETLQLKKIPCEFTPIYSGVRSYFPEAGRQKYLVGGKRPIGGGYIQTLAYDTETSDGNYNDGLITVKCGRKCFTLSDIIGSSGAAPEETVHKFGLTFIGFPEFKHFPIPQINDGKLFDAEEYAHGDGGHLENFGLMPLLARQVKKIIVFMNTPTPFMIYKSIASSSDLPVYAFTDDLAPLFGRSDLSTDPQTKHDPVKLAVNKVFDGVKLDELLDAYNQCRQQGKPLVHCADYEVKDNLHYGIRSYDAKICWIYLDSSANWLNLIRDNELKEKITRRHPKFERFPHYKTFAENPPAIIDLRIEQVNLLSHLTAWTVNSSGGYIRSSLGI